MISVTPEKPKKTPLKFRLPKRSENSPPKIESGKKLKISNEIQTPVVASLVKILDKKGKEKNKPAVHFCIFCDENAKSQQKIVRHWVDCHIDKEEVVEILTMKKSIDPKSQKLRSKKIDLLKQKGDYR